VLLAAKGSVATKLVPSKVSLKVPVPWIGVIYLRYPSMALSARMVAWVGR
jgi:hypothetical protein